MNWAFFKRRSQAKLSAPREDATPKPEPGQPAQASHLKEYLDYYRSLQNPEYAVLVTGDWGVGKTFQVRNAIPKEGSYYVSLFGLNTTDDVIAAVYAAMFPGRAFAKKIAGGIKDTTADVRGVGSVAISGLTSALVGAFLRQEVKTDKPIVFDDLERCGLDTKPILGIINLYVEHHGCRVVVIAHDEKLAGEFADMKEKLFGQTIAVEPNVRAAFDAFCQELSDRAEKALVADKREDIIGVFSESGAKSLRILRHLVEDLVRLAEKLDERHRTCDVAVTELFRLFAALDIEWRTNRLKEPDLRNRNSRRLGYSVRQAARQNDAPVPAIVEAADRYKSVDLTSNLLQDDVLCQMFGEGRFDKDAIRASLDASAFFIKPQVSPPWQIVIEFDKLDDKTVANGLTRMQRQFDRREILESGEMLHVFALQMMLSSKGLLGKDLSVVTAECKRYVDDVLRSGTLPPRPFDWRWKDELQMGAYHVGYWVTDEYRQQFEEVFRYLIDAREKALEKQFPQFGTVLLETLKADGKEFLEQVCYTAKGDNRFASIPVLASIDPKEFVAAWMQSSKANWHWISRGLRERYNGAHVEEVSKPESTWISEVVKLLNEEAEKASGLARLRIQRIVPRISNLEQGQRSDLQSR